MKKHRFTSRRNFLKTGAAGIAGSAFLSTCSRPAPQKQSKNRNLVYRTLGRTGLRLPVVSMGSSYAIDLVRAAHDEGIVYIHTSSSYSERNHERLLGAALRDLPRDSYVIATSPDLPYQWDRGRDRSLDVGTGVDPALISESLEGSLQRLGLDYVDIYYLGSIGRRESALHEPYLKAFEKLKKRENALCRSHDAQQRTGGDPRRCRERILGRGPHCLQLQAVSPRGGPGRHRPGSQSRTRRSGHEDAGRRLLGRHHGRKINMKAALKWVLQDENVHTTIPAFSNYDEMREDLSVMEDLALTPEERQDLGLGQALGLSGYVLPAVRPLPGAVPGRHGYPHPHARFHVCLRP